MVRAREAGKPVVASMGDVAASGGYFVSMAADAIVAQPGTLTGSIGVFSGKLVAAGLLERLGVGTDAVAEGPTRGCSPPRVGFDEEQWRAAGRLARPDLRRLRRQGRARPAG